MPKVTTRKFESSVPPKIVIKTIEYIFKNGLETEGIFRISGNKSEVLKIKKMFDKGKKVNLHEENVSPHVCADILKAHFRDLQEPIFTLEAYHYFTSIRDQPENLVIPKIRAFLPLLAENNRLTIIYLMTLLNKIAEKSDVNKMTAANLAIVFTPNLIRTNENLPITNSGLNYIIEILITNIETILEVEPPRRIPTPIKRVKSADFSYISTVSKNTPFDHMKKDIQIVNCDSSENLLEEEANPKLVSFVPPPTFLGELKKIQNKMTDGVRVDNLGRSFDIKHSVYQPTSPVAPPSLGSPPVPPPKVQIKLQSDDNVNTTTKKPPVPPLRKGVKSEGVLKELKRPPTYPINQSLLTSPRTFTNAESYEKNNEHDGSHTKPAPPPRNVPALPPKPTNFNLTSPPRVAPPVPSKKENTHRRSTSSPLFNFTFVDQSEHKNIPKSKPVPPPRPQNIPTVVSPQSPHKPPPPIRPPPIEVPSSPRMKPLPPLPSSPTSPRMQPRGSVMLPSIPSPPKRPLPSPGSAQ